MFPVTFFALSPLLSMAVVGLLMGQIPDPGVSTEGFLRVLLDAIAAGNWKYAAAVGFVGLAFVIRVYGPRLWAPLGNPILIAVITTLTSLSGALATAWGAGAPVTIDLVITAIAVGLPGLLGAIGAHVKIVAAEKAGTVAAAGVTTTSSALKAMDGK